MIITRCSECPFFRETPLTEGLLGIFASEEMKRMGTCNYDRSTERLMPSPPLSMESGPKRDEIRKRLRSRLVVKDNENPPPEDCPLRREPITIALKPTTGN